jgi:hypothetical protein
MDWSNFLGGAGQVGTAVAPLLGTGAQLYGQQNAAGAVDKANTAAIGNQKDVLGNIGSIYSPYTTGGAGAEAALGRAMGTNGQPADYSGFENMPGYKFALDTGEQAIQRQAAAMGSGYTPNTGIEMAKFATGTAMQDYNTYIQQLSSMADRGATSADKLGNITYNTGANISQLMQNTGQSQAGMYTGMGQTVAGALGGGYNPNAKFNWDGSYRGPGASGVGGGGIPGMIGNIASGVKTMFGGGDGTGATGENYKGPESNWGWQQDQSNINFNDSIGDPWATQNSNFNPDVSSQFSDTPSFDGFTG